MIRVQMEGGRMATYAEPVIERRSSIRRKTEVVTDHWSFMAPLGRALLSAIFIMYGFPHFTSQTIGYAAHHGVPAAGVLVPLSGVLAIVGGFSILLGYHARAGASLLIIFLLVVTPVMHNFWTLSEPGPRALQQGMFMKNLAMMGGAILVAYFGAGPWSVDWSVRRR
jgi:putative oxidoreductase